MRTKYYKDDIVEALVIPDYSNGILIGSRYYVTDNNAIDNDYRINRVCVYSNSDDNLYKYSYLKFSQLRLYKRPFKNWIKNLLNL